MHGQGVFPQELAFVVSRIAHQAASTSNGLRAAILVEQWELGSAKPYTTWVLLCQEVKFTNGLIRLPP